MTHGFTDNINILNKSLNGLWLRNKVINHNLSNINTPNYKRLNVNFEDSLREAINQNKTSLSATHERHLSKSYNIDEVHPSISIDKGHSYRFDGNNVNIDVESANLAKNAIMYNAVINQIKGEFNKIKNVITEGSR